MDGDSGHQEPGPHDTAECDRIQKLKTAGRSEKEVVAAKPLADLDAAWGKGFLMPDQFVQMAYNSL